MPPEAQDVLARVERILSDPLARPITHSDHGSMPLRELGLSSLRMIQLLTDLESAFDIRIHDDEVAGEHFGTLDGLMEFVRQKLEVRG